MQPYRSQPHEVYRVTFGDERRHPLHVVGALLAIALSVGSVLLWIRWGATGHGSILFLSLGGLLALFRRRSGSIEYHRAEGELVVRSRALLGTHEDRVPAHDVTGLTVVYKRGRSAPELVLLLEGGAELPLLRSPEQADLTAARATVSGFLQEHRLLPAHLREHGPEDEAHEDDGLDAREADEHR